MLPPFIIEQIRKREEDERRRRQESVVQLPIPDAAPRPKRPATEPVQDRGIVIIDLTG